MSRRGVRLAIVLAAALALGSPSLVAQSGNDLFQKALAKERAEGQLTAAIQLYEQIVREFAADRPLAARALLQIGRCHERLGNDGARKAYDRLVREYGDQQTIVEEARTRLAALAPSGARRAGPTARQVWGYDGYTDLSGTVSPDGRYLSCVDWETGDLAIRDLATGVTRRITRKGSWQDSSEYADASVISPDGKRIAYSWVRADGTADLRVIAVAGGQPRIRYHNADVPGIVPYDWTPDGRGILVKLARQDRTNQLAVLPADDGPVRVLKTFDWRFPWHAVFSPDGRYIAYDLAQTEDAPERDLFILAADGSRNSPLATHPAHDFLLGWAPGSDRVLFASDRMGTPAAWMIRVHDGVPQGDATLVRPNIGHVYAISFSRSGDYFYAVSTGHRDVYVTQWDAAAGKVDALAPVKGRVNEGQLAGVWSPDGAEMAYLLQSPLVTGGEGSNTLAIRSLASGQVRTIPLNMSYAGRLRWLPDRSGVILQGRDLKGRRGLFRVRLPGGEQEPVLYGTIPRHDISPDGRTLFYQRDTFIVRRDLNTGEEREMQTVPANAGMALSPDGKWLALKVNLPAHDGRPSIQIAPAAGGEPRTILTMPDVDPSSWRQMAWSPDGRTLLFTKSHKEIWQIPVAGGTPQKLAGGLTFISEISVHPDGRRLAVSAGNGKYELWVMENLLSTPSPSSPAAGKPGAAARR